MDKREVRSIIDDICKTVNNNEVEEIIYEQTTKLYEAQDKSIILEKIVDELEKQGLDPESVIEQFEEKLNIEYSGKIIITLNESYQPSEWLEKKFGINIYTDFTEKDGLAIIKPNKRPQTISRSQIAQVFNDIAIDIQKANNNNVYIEVEKTSKGIVSIVQQRLVGKHIKKEHISMRYGRFEPHKSMLWDKGYSDPYSYFNRFYATEYMNIEQTNEKPIPPLFDKLISNLTNTDEEKYALINWLAYFYQTLKKSTVSWIIKGEKGTGKGILMSILRKIYGTDYIYKESDAKSIINQFNSQWKDKLYIIFEEVNFTDLKADSSTIHSRLKDMITDTYINIEGKGANKTLNYPFYSNMMFFSNKETPIEIETGDRRYNIVEAPKKLTDCSWWDEDKTADAMINEHKEIAEYFANYKTCPIQYNKLIDNETRREQIEESLEDDLYFINKIIENDTEWLLSHSSLRNSIKSDTYTWGNHINFIFNRENLFKGKIRISKSDLETIFYLIYNKDLNTKLLKKKGYEYKPYTIKSYTINCYVIDYIKIKTSNIESIDELKLIEKKSVVNDLDDDRLVAKSKPKINLRKSNKPKKLNKNPPLI
ncbi:MAG: DUF5906 domain-containing protein [Campylobacterota bacterium]|nr:DUF5906 domain-containing protein [Campylobacterota bacterium]